MTETNDLLLFLLLSMAIIMPIDASLTPRRCALLMVGILGIFCIIVASFLSDLRLDAGEFPGNYDASWSTETVTGASEESDVRQFVAEKDTGPNPGYYMQHLHWFVQVRDSSYISGYGSIFRRFDIPKIR